MQGYPYSHENPYNGTAGPAIEKFNDMVRPKTDIHRVCILILYNIFRKRRVILLSLMFRNNYRDIGKNRTKSECWSLQASLTRQRIVIYQRLTRTKYTEKCSPVKEDHCL